MPEPVNQIKSNLLTTDIFFFLLKSWNVFHELVAHGPLMLDHRPHLQGHNEVFIDHSLKVSDGVLQQIVQVLPAKDQWLPFNIHLANDSQQSPAVDPVGEMADRED